MIIVELALIVELEIEIGSIEQGLVDIVGVLPVQVLELVGILDILRLEQVLVDIVGMLVLELELVQQLVHIVDKMEPGLVDIADKMVLVLAQELVDIVDMMELVQVQVQVQVLVDIELDHNHMDHLKLPQLELDHLLNLQLQNHLVVETDH